MTVEPGGKTTYFPFPGYSEEMVGTGVTARRVTYTIAGQAVASRVQLFSPTASNTLYYLYTDHLGSTVAQSNTTGTIALTPGSRTYYLPYGSYRGTPPTQTLTDRDFTGQRENRELGLLYYNARFYVPSIGRFASPDTIVPDPANPQQFNRYTYSLNSPLNFSDPSGHSACDYSLHPAFCSFHLGNTNALNVDPYNAIIHRHWYYGWAQNTLDGNGIESQWFQAAAIVTNVNGLAGAEIPVVSDWLIMSPYTSDFLQAGNEFLLPHNMRNTRDLINSGELSFSFEDANGEIVTFTGLTGMDMDFALVQYEQSLVQDFINLYASEHGRLVTGIAISGVNEVFTSYLSQFAGNPLVNEVMNEFFNGGKDFDFANYDDRVRLGQELVRKLYE